MSYSIYGPSLASLGNVCPPTMSELVQGYTTKMNEILHTLDATGAAGKAAAVKRLLVLAQMIEISIASVKTPNT